MSESLKPGDKVAIVAGRHSGAKGVLLKVGDEAGPSGSTYRLAVVVRPRAGETTVFEHEIAKLE